MSALAVLREARVLYAANPSHAPEDEWPTRGAVCIVQATAMARGALGASRAAEKAADVAIVAALDPEDPLRFNAEHSTEEVLAVFDQAIRAMEAGS